jgi:hypothetical protein
MKDLKLNDTEEWAWIEAGLACDGVEMDDWTCDAVVRYGRFLLQDLLSEMHDLRMQNSAQAAIIERLKTQIK